MKTSKETKLSNSTKIDFDLERNISDDQLEKIYGEKIATFTVGKQDANSPSHRFRSLWYLFFRFFKI